MTLDFPTDQVEIAELSPELIKCFNIRPTEAFKGKTDYMLVFHNEQEIKNLQPDLAVISSLKARGVIATAKGDEVDFVSRFFGPQSGVTHIAANQTLIGAVVVFQFFWVPVCVLQISVF